MFGFGKLTPSAPLTIDKLLSWETPEFKLDERGLPWAVFKSSDYSWEYNDFVKGVGIGNWGNYENAVLLQNTIGM